MINPSSLHPCAFGPRLRRARAVLPGPLGRVLRDAAPPLLAALLLAAPHPAVAAEWLGAARTPASYRTWTLEDADGNEATLSQIHVPAVTSVRLGGTSDLVLSTAYGSSKLEPAAVLDAPDPADLSVAGTADVKAQLFVRLWEDRILVQGGVNLPAGRKGLDPEELAVVQVLGNPLFGFRMKHYGAGLDLTGGGAVAFPLGRSATFALGGGFVHRGAYEFVEGEPDFQPGQEISGSAGLDLLANGSRPALRLDASYRVFTADQLDGKDVFEEGNQLELQASVSGRPGRARLNLVGRVVLKDDNNVLSPAGGDVEAIATDAGTALFVRGEAGVGLGTASYLGLQADWFRFDGGESPINEGNAYGLGPVFEQRLGPRGELRLGAQYLLGSTNDLLDEDGAVTPGYDLTGLDFSLTLAWRPGF